MNPASDTTPHARSSKLGIAGFSCATISTLMLVSTFAIMVILDRTAIDVPEPYASLGILFVPSAILLSIIAIVCGLAHLSPSRRLRGYALAGLIIGSGTLAIFAAIAGLVVVLSS